MSVLISSVFVSIFTRVEGVWFPSSHVWRASVVCACWRSPSGPGRLSVVIRGPLPAQARRAAVCGSSVPCPSSSVTSTMSATSRPATTTRTGCPPRSPCPCPWLPSRGRTSGPSSAGESSPSEQTHDWGRKAPRPQGGGYFCVFPFSSQTFNSLPFCLLIVIPELCDRNHPCKGLDVKVSYPLKSCSANPGWDRTHISCDSLGWPPSLPRASSVSGIPANMGASSLLFSFLRYIFLESLPTPMKFKNNFLFLIVVKYT